MRRSESFLDIGIVQVASKEDTGNEDFFKLFGAITANANAFGQLGNKLHVFHLEENDDLLISIDNTLPVGGYSWPIRLQDVHQATEGKLRVVCGVDVSCLQPFRHSSYNCVSPAETMVSRKLSPEQLHPAVITVMRVIRQSKSIVNKIVKSLQYNQNFRKVHECLT